MALPLLRGCVRGPSTCRLNRLFLSDRIILNRSGKTQIPTLSPTAAAAAVRPYSSDRGGQNKHPEVVMFRIPDPMAWIRTRLIDFMIRKFLDKEFNVEEFKDGTKQAFSHVSRLLSLCQFGALEGLVAKDLIGELEEKCKLLPLNHKMALSAESNEIIYASPVDAGIATDDNGRTSVSIQMCFWYLTIAQLDDRLKGIYAFNLGFGEERKGQKKSLRYAKYEFQRQFGKGAPPDWTITKIEHANLLD